MGNVPGTWIWMIDEDGVAPSDTHVWPGEARPILSVSYLCPTETYKAAQQARVCGQVQSGRKHSHASKTTCQTCIDRKPPRETENPDSNRQEEPLQNPSHPLREAQCSISMAACPTRVTSMSQSCVTPMHCTGTGMAPSHRPLPPINNKLQNLMEGGTAWDKRERVGEASHPGPEPPRELYLDRKNGQRDPIRLCTQNGGWVWNVHSVPPLRVAKRSTPQDALRNWLNKHENAITPASVEAARQLAKEWENYPMPQPIRRTRSMPPRESQAMTPEPLAMETSPPRETPVSQSQIDPPPRRRLRGKTPAQSSPGSPPRFCPADSSHGIESQHSEGMAEPYGCWDEIYDVLRKPVLVDRHIPRGIEDALATHSTAASVRGTVPD